MFPPGDDVLENDGVDDAVEEMLLDVVDGHPANDCVLVGGDTAIADEFHREDAPSPTVPDPATASLPGPSTSSAPPSTDASAPPSPTLSTVRTPTLSESELTLRQFQRFLLTDEQVAKFEDFFSKASLILILCSSPGFLSGRPPSGQKRRPLTRCSSGQFGGVNLERPERGGQLDQRDLPGTIPAVQSGRRSTKMQRTGLCRGQMEGVVVVVVVDHEEGMAVRVEEEEVEEGLNPVDFILISMK